MLPVQHCLAQLSTGMFALCTISHILSRSKRVLNSGHLVIWSSGRSSRLLSWSVSSTDVSRSFYGQSPCLNGSSAFLRWLFVGPGWSPWQTCSRTHPSSSGRHAKHSFTPAAPSPVLIFVVQSLPIDCLWFGASFFVRRLHLVRTTLPTLLTLRSVTH
jgi:hypothetical protein